MLSPKRAPEETTPANLTPFLADDELESRRLERVQGWALLFAAVVAVALPLYWLHEPSRQKESVTYFSKNAAERGKILFSNSSMLTYDPTQSLLCANCHGATGGGGQVAPARERQVGHLAGAAAQHRARTLPGRSGVRQPVDQQSDGTVCDVTNIITYGRPGTPMPAWGVPGGGPKNVQAIQDLVAFLRTIQLKPAEIKAQEAKNVDAAKSTDPNRCVPAVHVVPGSSRKTWRAKTLTDDTKTSPTIARRSRRR